MDRRVERGWCLPRICELLFRYGSAHREGMESGRNHVTFPHCSSNLMALLSCWSSLHTLLCTSWVRNWFNQDQRTYYILSMMTGVLTRLGEARQKSTHEKYVDYEKCFDYSEAWKSLASLVSVDGEEGVTGGKYSMQNISHLAVLILASQSAEILAYLPKECIAVMLVIANYWN